MYPIWRSINSATAIDSNKLSATRPSVPTMQFAVHGDVDDDDWLDDDSRSFDRSASVRLSLTNVDDDDALSSSNMVEMLRILGCTAAGCAVVFAETTVDRMN